VTDQFLKVFFVIIAWSRIVQSRDVMSRVFSRPKMTRSQLSPMHKQNRSKQYHTEKN